MLNKILMLPAMIFLAAAYVPNTFIKAKIKHPMLAGVKPGRWDICWPMVTWLLSSSSAHFWLMPCLM